MQDSSDWYSFLLNMNFAGVCLDFIGAVLIVYFGLWPALNLSNHHYSEVDFARKRRLCWRVCVVGLAFVIAGFSLQVIDISSKYNVTICC